MVEVGLERVVSAWAVGFVAHAIVMARSPYGDSRALFILGAPINFVVFLSCLLFLWPLLGL